MTLAVATALLYGARLEAAETAPPPGGRLEAGPTPGATASPTPGAALTLDDAVALALAHSPELRALEASMAEAAADAELANAFHPAASVSTTPGYATGLPIAVLGSVPAIGTIEAHRLIYDPAARANGLAASAQIDAARTQIEAHRRETAQSAAELYARYAADQALLDAARQRVSAYETMLAHTEALRKEGRVRDIDVDRAALQVSTERRRVSQAESRLNLDGLRLRRLIGWPDGPLNLAPDTLSAEPPKGDGLTVAQTDDPQLHHLTTQIEQLQRASALQTGFFQPTIAMQVQYSRLFDRFGRFYLNFRPDDLSVGLTIDVPLWNEGRRASTRAKFTAEIQQLTAQREGRRTEIEIGVREAESEVAEAMAENDLAGRSLALAQESLRLAKATAQEGRGEVNDVPLAEVALADAEEGSANARAHLVSAHSRLLIVRGELPRR
jgi:outer membrane protein TolC